MRDLLQDIWHDLRAKRLWPVAALLALAILAVPAVLLESSAAPSEPEPAPTAGPARAEGPKVQLDTADADSSGVGSALDVFAAKDPFKPPKGVTSSASTADSGATAGATGGDSGATPGGSGDIAPDGGGGVAPGQPPAPGGPDAQPPAEFEYVADVTFWQNGKRRKQRGVHKLDMLPNQAAPVLIFMGASENGGNAVFLVDSTLKAAGEGRCEPSRSNCAFVHIGPGSEHSFTNDLGDSYRLRIDEIRRVRLGATSAAEGPLARTSTGSTRRFALPSLVDLVLADGGEPEADDHSSNPQRGR
ncbi:MAG TPA: hypothetical protein VEX36_03215 [Thermoleophilaceae bacterium]|nr:hypothetical protein [Thermoleophilaceae bacterium]